MNSNETIVVGWCDNGTTEGSFTESVSSLMLRREEYKIPITGLMRVLGNQIARQRQVLFDKWANETDADWILWIDSDIRFNLEHVQKIINSCDKDERPIVSGVYFISKSPEKTIMQPMPCIFYSTEKENVLNFVHPLPKDNLIEIDSCGMGFVIMHRQIIDKLKLISPNESFFAEKNATNDNDFVGEDIAFFNKINKAKIPVYADTSILLDHMKKFSLDINYYNMYWDNIDKIIQ
jgi:hypothetical protein